MMNERMLCGGSTHSGACGHLTDNSCVGATLPHTQDGYNPAQRAVSISQNANAVQQPAWANRGSS